MTALKNPSFESVYNFTHFNPIQTQIFHTLYHTDNNLLLGAPTGSGKTICAEIAIFRLFRDQPKKKVVYIGPLKALVRERVDDWKKKLVQKLGKKVVELTGDVTPDLRSIQRADIIVTTPEKWDSISRNWNNRKYVQDVRLIVIDEIHLLNQDRGPVLEIIVSRTNFINQHTGHSIRIIGLSTAIANAQDLAAWLNIRNTGLYNFKPSVRPVPLEVHIAGFSGDHYCPRMALMNKSVYRGIRQHSPKKPVIVFVSSRRQTRLTAMDLIAFVAQDDIKQWINMTEGEINYIIENQIKDTNLKLTLAFGIGLHHAGLDERDRSTCEELFASNKIQILVSTSTLAWGVNLPAHLVIVKGTEYFDGKQHKYVDFPITDVLQMMGRAGRPQFDKFGKALILVHDKKKEFYKKFLYEPFPVESSLIDVLDDHLNAEIVANTIRTKEDCIQYLSWTFLFRRMLKNPSYYGLDGCEPEQVSKFLSTLVDTSLAQLEQSGCIDFNQDDESMASLPLGQIASFYYLKHKTVKLFFDKFTDEHLSVEKLLMISAQAHEFDELPVRHNEDILNEELARACRYKVTDESYDDPHTKAFLLLQSHFERLELPNSDYLTDLKLVLDQYIRVVQAMIDISSLKGLTMVCVRCIYLIQMSMQGRWFDQESVLQLPDFEKRYLACLEKNAVSKRLVELVRSERTSGGNVGKTLASVLTKNGGMKPEMARQVCGHLSKYPLMDVTIELTNLQNGQRSPLDSLAAVKNGRQDEDRLSALCTNCDYMIRLKIPHTHQRTDAKAITPKYAKSKEEGWFVVLQDKSKEELVAIKRVTQLQQQGYVVFTTSAFAGTVDYQIRLVSDCYIDFEFCQRLRFRLEEFKPEVSQVGEKL